jgi:hypothetical protein
MLRIRALVVAESEFLQLLLPFRVGFGVLEGALSELFEHLVRFDDLGTLQIAHFLFYLNLLLCHLILLIILIILVILIISVVPIIIAFSFDIRWHDLLDIWVGVGNEAVDHGVGRPSRGLYTLMLVLLVY